MTSLAELRLASHDDRFLPSYQLSLWTDSSLGFLFPDFLHPPDTRVPSTRAWQVFFYTWPTLTRYFLPTSRPSRPRLELEHEHEHEQHGREAQP